MKFEVKRYSTIDGIQQTISRKPDNELMDTLKTTRYMVKFDGIC